MKKFKMGARVLVTRVQEPGSDPTEIAPPARGRVVRLLNRDEGAWIALDKRQENKPGVHPFPESDDVGRGTWVCAYPDSCSPVKS